MLRNTLRAIMRDEGGNIILLLSVFIIALVIGCGLAVDISRAQVLRSRMQAQADSAALAVGVKSGQTPMTDAEITSKATAYFNAGFPPGYLQSYNLRVW